MKHILAFMSFAVSINSFLVAMEPSSNNLVLETQENIPRITHEQDTEAPNIILVCDQTEFRMTSDMVKQSVTLFELIRDQPKSRQETPTIHVQNIKSDIMRLMIELMEIAWSARENDIGKDERIPKLINAVENCVRYNSPSQILQYLHAAHQLRLHTIYQEIAFQVNQYSSAQLNYFNENLDRGDISHDLIYATQEINLFSKYKYLVQIEPADVTLLHLDDHINAFHLSYLKHLIAHKNYKGLQDTLDLMSKYSRKLSREAHQIIVDHVKTMDQIQMRTAFEEEVDPSAFSLAVQLVWAQKYSNNLDPKLDCNGFIEKKSQWINGSKNYHYTHDLFSQVHLFPLLEPLFGPIKRLDIRQVSSLPESFGNLVNLTNLILDDSNFKSLPESFGELINLTELYIDNTALTSLPESFSNLVNLTKLSIIRTLLTSLSESFGKLVNLTELSLYGNKLLHLPESFGKLTKLTTLFLHCNRLLDLPKSFGYLRVLKSLTVHNNQLGSIPESFGNLLNISKVDLSDNQLLSLPESFSDLINIEELLLQDNQISILPKDINKLLALKKLRLENNQLSELPEGFGNLINLTQLDLGHNKLQMLPASFGEAVKLKDIKLNGNKLLCLPENFGNLINLTELDLRHNKLQMLPASFGKAVRLKNIYLGNNEIIAIPENFGSLVNLFHLDLSHNKLGSLWENISNLTRLKYLNLGYNNLGNIPKNIGKLSRLTTLLLNNNQLTTFPRDIGNLIKLEVLNLQDNKL